MAKRDNRTKRTPRGTATANALEQRVLAFAAHLGRIAGTVQAQAEGWMDRETLSGQIASVRDGAAHLLEQIAGSATRASKERRAATTPRGGTRGRSGDMVDARGKTHRKPMPTDPGANIADSQATKMRAAKTMVKTHRRRGRG